MEKEKIMKIIREALDSEPLLKYIFLLFKYLFVFLKWFTLGLLFGFGSSEYTYVAHSKKEDEEHRKRDEEHHRLGGQIQWELDH